MLYIIWSRLRFKRHRVKWNLSSVLLRFVKKVLTGFKWDPRWDPSCVATILPQTEPTTACTPINYLEGGVFGVIAVTCENTHKTEPFTFCSKINYRCCIIIYSRREGNKGENIYQDGSVGLKKICYNILLKLETGHQMADSYYTQERLSVQTVQIHVVTESENLQLASIPVGDSLPAMQIIQCHQT